MRRFAASGIDAAGIGVHAANPSGALRLYEGLGDEHTASTCIHQFTQADEKGAASCHDAR